MLWIRWHHPPGNRSSTDSPEKVLVSQTSSSFFYASVKNSQDVQCVNDNRIWLLCLNPPLEPRGRALTNQPVQSSPIAWRALCGGEPCLCQSCSHSTRCEGLWASNVSATSQKMLQEAELYLPAPLHCSGSFRLSLSCSLAERLCAPEWRCAANLTSLMVNTPKGKTKHLKMRWWKLEYSFEIIGLGGWRPLVRPLVAPQAHSYVTKVG